VIAIVPLSAVDPGVVDALLDRAFGPDRHARTAYKVRGPAEPIRSLSFAATEGEALLGSIQCWPVKLAGDDGGQTELVMVGPVAVEPGRQRDGIGRRLVTAALDAAGAHGLDAAMMLIGDPEYYERFFGFSAAKTGDWRLPGPVESRRVLARGDAVPVGPGMLGPCRPADA